MTAAPTSTATFEDAATGTSAMSEDAATGTTAAAMSEDAATGTTAAAMSEDAATGTAAPTAADAASDAPADPAGGSMEQSAQEVMFVTDAARAAVLAIRDREDDAETLGLRVEVTGEAGVDYTYDLALDPVSDAAANDRVHTAGGLTVVVPDASVDRLRGATLDVPSIPGQGGLVIRNPNRPNPLGEMGRLELTGDVSQKVTQLLDMSINPALASHGGYAELVGVRDDGSVVVTMGGGCQGCAMSQATLSEGIQRAILEAIPEVTEVIDATDHAAGENPYFA